MSKITLIKTWEGNFRLAYDSDVEKAKKVKIGEAIEVDYKKPRNYEFHKKFFSLLNLTFDNQQFFDNFEHFREYALMKSGHYIEVKTPTASFFKAKSLKFGKMSQEEFEKVYSDVLNFCLSYLDIKKEDIVQELINYA